MLALAHMIWNFFIGLSTDYITLSPVSSEGFGDVWITIQSQFGTFFYSIGVAVLNLFFLIGFVRQASNLKQSYTLESFIEAAIKLVLANALMYHCWNLMAGILSIATYMTPSGSAITFDTTIDPAVVTADLQDLLQGGMLTGALVVIILLIYLLVSMICGIMIFITVYTRHFQVFVLATTAPLALSTIAGGESISRTGYSWIRAFLGKAFEIVIIGLSLAVGSMIANQLSTFVSIGTNTTMNALILEVLTMIIITASVKGADVLMTKVFSL